MGQKYGTVAFIPLKNIRNMAGRPLVYWVLDAAVESRAIDKVFVATDSKIIRETVENYGNPKIEVIERAPETCTDTASTESAMLDFAAKYNFDFIYLIQATSPLLTAENLDAGFDKMTSNNADSLLSVVEQKRFIWKSRGDFAAAQNYSPLARPRRQDFEGYLVENGAFYLTGRKQLLESSCRISGKIAVQLMSEETYYELDEDYDWNIIEAILYKRFIKKCDSLDNLSTVKLLVTDVDGVLTDSGMYYTADGDTMKKFSTRDGMGLRLLMESGLEVAIITGENSEIVARRAEKLKIQHVFRGIDDKITVLKNLCNELGITLKEVAYVGDDVNDLECISQVGFSACPADAHEKIMKLASLKLSKKGGEGCVRELCDLIMQANDK